MHTYDSLEVGDTFSFDRTFTQEDVRQFAALTGDDNPIHVNPVFAETTRFGHTIVHGVFLLGIVSKVLGKDFPGYGSVAVNISCRFLRPVPVGDTITVEVKVSEKIEKYRHVRIRIYVYNAGKMVLGGDATVIPPGEDSE